MKVCYYVAVILIIRNIIIREAEYLKEPRRMYRHTPFYCASKIILFFFLNKFKICGNATSIKFIGTIFSKTFAHFMSLCHILVILPIFQTFSLLLYLLWWSVISHIWCHYYDLLKAQMVAFFSAILSNSGVYIAVLDIMLSYTQQTTT